MADLNIRNVDVELIRGLKKAAIEDGVSLREMCLRILNFAVLPKKDDSVVEKLIVAHARRPFVPKQEELSPDTRESVSEPEIDEDDLPEPEPEWPMCSYREYDSESGETYGCRLREHGPKVKHQRGEKL